MTQHSCSQANRTVKFVLAEIERANHRRCLQETLLESLKGNVWYTCVFLFVSLGARFALMQTEWDGWWERKKGFFFIVHAVGYFLWSNWSCPVRRCLALAKSRHQSDRAAGRTLCRGTSSHMTLSCHDSLLLAILGRWAESHNIL